MRHARYILQKRVNSAKTQVASHEFAEMTPIRMYQGLKAGPSR